MSLPTIKNTDKLLPTLEQWRQRLNVALPNENEFVGVPGNSWFEVVDSNTIRFRFDPGPNAESHDLEWSQDADFKKKASVRLHSDAFEWQVPLTDAFTCNAKYYFRVRAIRGDKTTRWSPTAVFGTPVPAALLKMTAGHAVDNVEEENPFINVNMVLPRTATMGARTIEDIDALWTDHVDVEADWSALVGAITDVATTMTVTAGQGVYFKEQGFYKIETEIVKVTSVATDVVTVERAQYGTTAAAHANTTTIRFYARILREMFTASQNGTVTVTLTIPNPEKVRLRDFEAWAVNRCDERSPISTAQALLNTPPVIIDLAANPLFQKVVLTWSEQAWPAYRYEVYHSTTVPIPIADLDPTLTTGVTKLGRPLADHEGEAKYTHEVKFAAGTVHYFGVRSVDIFAGFRTPGGGDTVGPLQPDQFPTPVAPDVTNISATEGPAIEPLGPPTRSRTRARVRSSVTAGFDPPNAAADPDGIWGGVRLFLQVTGTPGTIAKAMDAIQTTMRVSVADLQKTSFWQFFKIDAEVVQATAVDYSTDDPPGSGTILPTVTISRAQFSTTAATHVSGSNLIPFEKPVQVGEGDEAPLHFTFPAVGAVTLYFVSVTKDGRQSQILSSPNLTVTLDGQTSPPLEVQNLRGIKTQSGGKIFWSEGKEPDLAYYEVADLGSRTLPAQADIVDKHIFAKVDAAPTSGKRAQWEWQEVEYAGEIAMGSSSVVLGSASAPLAQLADNRFDPIGATPVKETLRFTWSSDVSRLTTTDYQINSNDEDTIILASAPSEASAANVKVRFHIGGRAHKFYVRAVNDSGLASEWRPIESTFLDLSALAPDGTNDVSVPQAIRAIPPFAATTSIWTLGHQAGSTGFTTEDRPGSVYFQLVVESEDDADTNFDTALKQSIAGVTEWEVQITYSGGVKECIVPADTDRSRYSYFTPPFLNGRWQLINDFFVDLPNAGVTAVSARVKNWFGWSATAGPVASLLPPGAGPHHTGHADLEKIISETPDVSNNLYPNLAESRRFKVALTANVTVKPPEYRSGGTTKGSGLTRRLGEIFTVVLEQDATGGRTVTFDAAYKGLDGKEADLRPNRYAAWTFQVESASYFRCIGFLTGTK